MKKIEGGEIIGYVAETPAPESAKGEAPKKRTTKKTAESEK